MKKLPPKKPHFLKAILPGFKNGLKIPVGFLKYVKGDENVHAILRRGSKKWVVKVKGRRMEDGWTEFAEEHDLQLGDMLVFRHEGNMEFDVSIFGSSCCEREYMQEDEDEEEEETPNKFHLEEKTKANMRTSDKGFPNVKAANKEIHNSHSHLICTIKPYCLTKCFLYIPRQFALDNRLKNRKCTIIVRDERRSWTCSLYTSVGKTYIGRGWHEFCTDKCLKEGDRVMFEIVSNGETPIFKAHDLRGSPSLHQLKKKNYLDAKRISDEEKTKANIKASDKAFPNVEAAEKDKHLTHSHFICTIRPYCLSKHFVTIPRQFALKNRLNKRKCMIIIRDERRSWTFSLYTSGETTYIGRGWREFCIDKCLKEGDRVMFEIVSNGETPIFKFHDLRGSPPLHPEVKKKNNLDAKRISNEGTTDLRIKTTDATSPKVQVAASTCADANPHFISTIKPYTIKHPVFCLPLAFAKSNGLMNRQCEMILVNEKRKSWSVQLGKMGYHFGIKRGWREFVQANGVQVGDTYKFELISNGTIPIAHFHCKYSEKDVKNHPHKALRTRY